MSPPPTAAADEQLVARLAARAAVGGGLVLELVDRRPADGTRAHLRDGRASRRRNGWTLPPASAPPG
jgi:hypothetical protein